MSGGARGRSSAPPARGVACLRCGRGRAGSAIALLAGLTEQMSVITCLARSWSEETAGFCAMTPPAGAGRRRRASTVTRRRRRSGCRSTRRTTTSSLPSSSWHPTRRGRRMRPCPACLHTHAAGSMCVQRHVARVAPPMLSACSAAVPVRRTSKRGRPLHGASRVLLPHRSLQPDQRDDGSAVAWPGAACEARRSCAPTTRLSGAA